MRGRGVGGGCGGGAACLIVLRSFVIRPKKVLEWHKHLLGAFLGQKARRPGSAGDDGEAIVAPESVESVGNAVTEQLAESLDSSAQ